jgi:enoyl-CoA hydratase/carnithine racemase
MDGFTLGGGMGLAQGCDLRVVTERSRLGMPEVGIGYFPMSAAAISCRACPASWVSTWASAAPRSGRRRLYCGLADWYLDSDKLAALGLDRLAFGDHPLKDLQGLLAGLAPRPGRCAAGKLRPVIDHFFALPDLPSIIEQLRAVSIGDSHQWALTPPTCWKPARRWPWP